MASPGAFEDVAEPIRQPQINGQQSIKVANREQTIPPTQNVYSGYQSWLTANGLQDTGENAAQFGTALRAAEAVTNARS